MGCMDEGVKAGKLIALILLFGISVYSPGAPAIPNKPAAPNKRAAANIPIAPKPAVVYKKEECKNCHPDQVNDIASAGRKHRSVPCIGCHTGHPPEVEKPIAECTKCHLKTRKSHFEVPGCLNCHKNPHTPLNITFSAQAGCFNCHGVEVRQLSDNPSRHTALGCVFLP